MDRYIFCHHKCASNWLWRYAQDLSQQFDWRLEARNGGPPESHREDSEACLWFFWNSWPQDLQGMSEGARGVHLIRDPRDALVSGYWSWRDSHRDNNELILRVREQLQQLPFEEGLMLMVDYTTSLWQLQDWSLPDPPQVLTVRYEDMVADTSAQIAGILQHLDITMSPDQRAAMVERHSFTAITGRTAGEERQGHHFRKGVAGDWRTVFTERVRNHFEARHGEQMRRLGYDW